MDDEAPLPSTIGEVEALILSLYEPTSTPAAVSHAQSILQRLQKTPYGWELARQLLSRPDQKVKFFGALTIIVKLNTESSSLAESDTSELLDALIGWLLKSLEDGSGGIVVRKLTSALATYFLHFPRLWKFCVRHLVLCLASDQCIQQASTDDDLPSIQGPLQTLSQARLQAALWFVATVAEDATKVDMNSPMHIGLYDAILENMSDVSALLMQAISPQFPNPNVDRHISGVESIKCFQSWIWFAQRMSIRDERLVGALRPLVQPLIEALVVEELYDAAAETVTEILSNYSGFLTSSHYEMLHTLFESSWSQGNYQRLVDGDSEFESVQFGHLLLAFGDARVHILMTANDNRSNLVLSKLCGLLEVKGAPVVDDKVFVLALEFWSTFIETMTDNVYSDDTAQTSWGPVAMEHVQRAVSLTWQKIAFPPVEIFNSWDSADKTGFLDARKDVADLLQSSFTLMGSRLVSMFAEATLHSLEGEAWTQLEAVAFCLGSLADCVNGDPHGDSILEPVFSPVFFTSLLPSRQNMPARTRQTCASLIEKYAEYFERHPDILPHALNLLFGILEDPLMGSTASKSIHRLCSSCRTHLSTQAGAFLHQYASLTSNQLLDCLTSEKILGAVAAAIQPLRNDEDKVSGLTRLLGFIHGDLRLSWDTVGNPTAPLQNPPCRKLDRCMLSSHGADPALHAALRGLRCLVCVGKGSQAPVDGPIDLDSESQFASRLLSSGMQQLQASLMDMIMRTRAAFPSSGEVVELICNILRTGFSESEPGLFVLAPDQVCEYLSSHETSAPRIGMVVSTACSFISSSGTALAPGLNHILARMLHWVITLLRHLPRHDSDTELSQNGIEFVNRLVAKHADVFLMSTPQDCIEFFLLFTLTVLEGSEPLPKAAAADFWVTFVMLRPEEPGLQACLNTTMAAVGPLLAQSIIRNVGGNASRSELDKISEPLKRLAAYHPRAKAWLEAALADPSFPAPHVSTNDRSLFVKRVLSLKGAKGTNQVVRDFWLSSRGSSFSYTT